MTQPAIRKDVGDGQAAPKQTSAPDWESIEREFRAGVLSIREIAKRHGLTDTAIRKRAKAWGWERDLTAKVQEEVRRKLVRTEVRITDVRTEREIVEQAAQTVVEVVRLHRRDARHGREILDLLMGQLADAAGAREEIEEAIAEETADVDDPNAQPGVRQAARYRRSAMLKAVALPTHFASLRDAATAMGKLVAIERQAFNINGAPEEPAKEVDTEAYTDAALEAFAAKMDAFLHGQTEAAT